MNDVLVLIPVFNPTSKLIDLVNQLIENGYQKIIIVNDGSKKGKKIFERLKETRECDVLDYTINKGKGYALKYGINHYLLNYKTNFKGIVTTDCDLQHSIDDIKNISLKLLGNLDSLIIGGRDFNLKSIPTLNKFGNKITASIFNLLYQTKIKDTQTGLRAIPNRYLNLCLEIKGKRFEYETNMLIKFSNKKINIIEIPIETIYYKNGKSNFNKIIDSIRIYQVIFSEYIKFLLSSLTCYTIDIVLFSLLNNLFNTINSNLSIIFATILARVIADFFNFNINKTLVFDSHENNKTILFKYYLLSVSKMITSALFVLLFHSLFSFINETIIKMIVDTIIYVISYKIQKKYIFRT